MSFYRNPLFGAAVRRYARAALKCVPLFAIALVMMANGFGQETGTIRGKVKNLATGKLLNNALVINEATGQSTYTNEYGEFRFPNVSTGEVTLTASFVGLEAKSVTLVVEPGVAATAEIALYSGQYGMDDEEVYELEAFTVDGSDYDSNAIAQNERKNSANLKIVQHADALGEIAEGNIGEYLKNLPGVSINYVAADARSIKLRGMGSAFTNVSVDGAQMASAASGGKSRSFELEQVSLSNVEQLEISKLPKASDPANSIGGSVNLVSKNAFAQGGRKINYKAYMSLNSNYFELGQSPGWTPDAERSKAHPGYELNYSDVFFNDRLGVSLSFSESNQFNIQQRFRWREYNLPSTTSTADELYFTRLEVQDGPKFTHRQSVAANLDFKATENTVITLRTQGNWYDSSFRNRNYSWRIDNRFYKSDGTPDRADAANPAESDNTTTYGSDRGTVVGGSFRDKFGTTYHVDLGAKHTFDTWRLDYGVWKSEATNHYRDTERGVMETMTTKVNGIDMIRFAQASTSDPFSMVTAYDDDGNVIPNYGIDLSNTQWDRAHTRAKDSVDKITGYRINATKDFNIGEQKASLKIGALRTEQRREAMEKRFRWTTEGAANDVRLDDFYDEVYSGTSPGFGYDGFEWPSSAQMNDYFVNNPDLFKFDANDSLNRLRDSYLEMEETVTAYYLMGQMDFLGDKGLITAGVRVEETDVWGRNPIVGEVYLDDNLNLAGNFAETNIDYTTTHPSFHVRYNVTDKLVLRFAYANTIGRQDFADMFGTTAIVDYNYIPPSEDDPEGTLEGGDITIKNPALEPRKSDNMDLTAEYYFGETSMFSLSLFQNDMENYAGTVSRQVTEEDVAKYGLPESVLGGTVEGYPDQTYQAYNISIPENFGDAKVKGFELNWNQGLNFQAIPSFLRRSSFYGNGTFLSTKGDFEGTNFAAFSNDFPDFAKETISYGFIYDGGPLSVKFRWNVRGEEVAGSTGSLMSIYYADINKSYSQNGDDFRNMSPNMVEKRTTLDINADYKVNDKLSLYMSVRNVTDAPWREVYYLPDANGNAQAVLNNEQRFGAQYTFGLKGSF